MKNKFTKATLLLTLLLIYLACPAQFLLGRELLLACGDDQVLMIDSAASDSEHLEIVWKWEASKSDSLPESFRKYMRSNDECKPVDQGRKILVTSSSGGVVLIDRISGECLFHAYVPNAHSAEYLPGDRISVALSTAEKGNSLELYDVGRPGEVLYRDALHSGHGVVWINETRTLFALGGSELRAYSLDEWESEQPGLTMMKTWKLPGKGGHDLVSVSDDRLVLTTVDGVWNFDITREEFSVFEPLAGVENVKSVNYDLKSGRLIYTKGEVSWWTENIYLRNPDKVIKVPGLKLYKVRALSD